MGTKALYRLCPQTCGRTPSSPGGCNGDATPPDDHWRACWCPRFDKRCYEACRKGVKKVDLDDLAQAALKGEPNICPPVCPNYQGQENGWKCHQNLEGIRNKHCHDRAKTWSGWYRLCAGTCG